MKFFFIFLFLYIKKIFLLTPTWNLKTTADDLLLNKDTTTITLSEGGYKTVINNNKIILEKQLTRKNGNIIEKNYYKIDNYEKKHHGKILKAFIKYLLILYVQKVHII